MGSSKQRIAVVVNGNAKNVTADVISTLDQILAGSDLFVSKKIEEAAEIAELLIEREYSTVLTGGGDGTFTVMVTEIVRAAAARGVSPPRFGLLKLGTGNALAWVVGASPGKAGMHADITRLREDAAGSREIRLVDVEGFLTPFAGLGADAQVLADYNATKAWMANTPLRPVSSGLVGYAVAATTRSLPGYLLGRMPRIRVYAGGAEAHGVGADGELIRDIAPPGALLFEGPARLAALSTIPFVGFGFKLFPHTGLSPGCMQLRVSTISSTEFVRNLGPIWRGTYANEQTVRDFLVDKLTIEAEPEVEFQIGGDPQGKRDRVLAAVSSSPIRLVDFYARRPFDSRRTA